jgi:DNA-nicking Smr family endonuclease
MTGSGDKPGGGKRAITDAEADLWSHATRSLAPLKAKPRVADAKQPASAVPRASPPPPRPEERPSVQATAPKKPESTRRASPPPLADFDRRKARQISAGKVEIEARIDLHGLRQRDAVHRLRAFLLDAHARGLRTVLVITGKGGEAERGDTTEMLGQSRRGVLRRNVPHWLEAPELRAVVLGYTNASVRHGGDGAIYVQLRKSRRSGERE